MNKARLLKIVNITLFICALHQIVTGLTGHLIGDLFETLHPAGGILFGVLALIHIVLNWAWVKANLLK